VRLRKLTWNLSWGNYFPTKKVYRKMIGDHETPQPILDIWKTCNIPRHKLFAWFLLHVRLSTKDMMKKKIFYVEF
jgi:hypothetical protein